MTGNAMRDSMSGNRTLRFDRRGAHQGKGLASMDNVNIRTFDEMIGQTMVKASGDFFESQDGTIFEFYHEQDCCESVSIDDIVGDIDDLVGAPLTIAEEVSTEGAPEVDGDSITWTFYRFGTAKGVVTVKWLGESNGYYSESVDFRVIPKRQQQPDSPL